jgi:hypothetical protein
MNGNLESSKSDDCSLFLDNANGASLCQLIYVDSVSTKEIKHEERFDERKQPSAGPTC